MKPTLQALVIAEHIYQDVTGKKIIAGTFTGLRLRRCLAKSDSADRSSLVRGGVPGSPSAYIALTDVCNGTILELQFVSLSRNAVLLRKELKLDCKSRLDTVEIVASLPPLPIPEPGVYAFEIVCEGEILGSSRLIAEIESDEVARR